MTQRRLSTAGMIWAHMGFLHRDEPVTDATVNCPECRAIDWVVRAPRLGGQGKIVCRACGFVHGPYFPTSWAKEVAPAPKVKLDDAEFPVYVPEGLAWIPQAYYADVGYASATVACEEPWVAVTTEPLATATEAPEALRDALLDVLPEAEPSGLGRSDAAYLLEVDQLDARLEAEVADLAIEAGALRVDGREVPCQVLVRRESWAAYAVLDEVAVIVASGDVAISDVALTRRL